MFWVKRTISISSLFYSHVNHFLQFKLPIYIPLVDKNEVSILFLDHVDHYENVMKTVAFVCKYTHFTFVLQHEGCYLIFEAHSWTLILIDIRLLIFVVQLL